MKRKRLFIILLGGSITLVCSHIYAQDKLYHNLFPLNEVTLLNRSFKHARDLNIQTLLKYNADRLLVPCRKEAVLSPKESSYQNWNGLLKETFVYDIPSSSGQVFVFISK
jgi:hypothetical protein